MALLTTFDIIMRTKSDAQLAFIRDDSAAALAANPTGEKAHWYLSEHRAACKENERRECIRAYRRAVGGHGHDLLAIRQRRTAETGRFTPIRGFRTSEYERRAAADARFSLAWLRLHG